MDQRRGHQPYWRFRVGSITREIRMQAYLWWPATSTRVTRLATGSTEATNVLGTAGPAKIGCCARQALSESTSMLFPHHLFVHSDEPLHPVGVVPHPGRERLTLEVGQLC